MRLKRRLLRGPLPVFAMVLIVSLGMPGESGAMPALQTSESDWPMLQHDVRHTGYTPITFVSPEYEGTSNVKWKVGLGERIEVEMQPIVAYGHVYIGVMNGKLHAIDEEIGEITWTYQPGEPISHTVFLPIVHKSRHWTDCSQSSFGTMLIHSKPDDYITPADVLIYANDQLGVKGMTGTGAPSELVRDEWFGRLPGWTRSFMRGIYAQLEPIHETAITFGMEDMYECLLYGPESAHQAGEEALDPLFWVPKAEAVAEAAGKCLIYAPAVRDYELLATPTGADQPLDDLLESLIAQVAPHVDIWMVQLGKYQPWVDAGHDDDGNPYTMDDFKRWIAKWVSWIKTANPNTKVWTQLGIGKVDPIQKVCLPPQPPEYILEFREVLISAGVDGVWVMPSQPCMPCPPSPPPGFPCSTDPQDNEYYRQSLASFKQAIEMACEQ